MTYPASYTPIDSAPLRMAVSLFVRLSVAVLDGAQRAQDLPQRGLSRLSRYTQIMARLMREIRKTEVENRRAAGLLRLAHDGAWRASVRRALGGEAVISRWQAKLCFHQAFRAHHPVSEGGHAAGAVSLMSESDFGPEFKQEFSSEFLPELLSAPALGGAKRPRRDVPTAAGGLFRLAPVPRLPELENTQRLKTLAPQLADSAAAPSRAPAQWRLTPFPLLPHHLQDAGQAVFSGAAISVQDVLDALPPLLYGPSSEPPSEPSSEAPVEPPIEYLKHETISPETISPETISPETWGELMTPEMAWAMCLEAAPPPPSH